MTDIIINTATILTSLGTIGGFFTYIFNKIMDKKFEPLNTKMDKKDYNDCKRYLTDFITDLKNGIPKSEIQIKMASETYDHYHRPKDEGGLGGNTWVEDNWNKLKEEGKI